MLHGIHQIHKPQNEKVLTYVKGSAEREALLEAIAELKSNPVEIPLIIGGQRYKTEKSITITAPHDHSQVLGKSFLATEADLIRAIDASQEAKVCWEAMPIADRASIFLKAAELISGPYRALMNAATMLGQSKTAHQAEIDSACELIDFLRFNAYYMDEIYREQPHSTHTEWNRMSYRPLEGFVLAISPFNFTAIGGNLPTSPALMGNTVLWKPAEGAIYSNYFFMQILEEAGLPKGVINFIPCSGSDISRYVVPHPLLAGVHFTGSTGVFEQIWQTIGTHIANYKSYPRLVGETGGKDFIFAHESCDVSALATAMIRGAFEYQGQKCSAASRAYIPSTIWPELSPLLSDMLSEIKMGDVVDLKHFMGAVINRKSYESIKSYIDEAKSNPLTTIFAGGVCDDSKGYFIEPTLILSEDPHSKTMTEEIFGPVLTVYLYEPNALDETLELCNQTSPYALTGAIFAKDRYTLMHMADALYYACGNLYFNDKPTGAVVGQQPFGGARKSGTNDKAGSKLNLLRWCNAQTIKENFCPPKTYDYPSMR